METFKAINKELVKLTQNLMHEAGVKEAIALLDEEDKGMSDTKYHAAAEIVSRNPSLFFNLKPARRKTWLRSQLDLRLV